MHGAKVYLTIKRDGIELDSMYVSDEMSYTMRMKLLNAIYEHVGEHNPKEVDCFQVFLEDMSPDIDFSMTKQADLIFPDLKFKIGKKEYEVLFSSYYAPIPYKKYRTGKKE